MTEIIDDSQFFDLDFTDNFSRFLLTEYFQKRKQQGPKFLNSRFVIINKENSEKLMEFGRTCPNIQIFKYFGENF